MMMMYHFSANVTQGGDSSVLEGKIDDIVYKLYVWLSKADKDIIKAAVNQINDYIDR